MKNTLKINHENRTLVMDRTFAKAASFVGSNEYNLLQDYEQGNAPEMNDYVYYFSIEFCDE